MAFNPDWDEPFYCRQSDGLEGTRSVCVLERNFRIKNIKAEEITDERRGQMKRRMKAMLQRHGG